MDLSMRNELPKMGQDTRYLVDQQRLQRDKISKECDEYEARAKFLKNKIREIEEKIFNTQMGDKIKELVKENLKLSIDAQCLSIELDIYNQGMDRGVVENNFHPAHVSPSHGMGSPMGMMNRSITPTNSPNVVTLDTSTYPYAQPVVSPNLSPYPIQPGIPTLPYPMTGNMVHHLAPHHPPETARQMSMGPPVHHPSFYNFQRQGSVNILNQVPPPASWVQPGNFAMNPISNPAPPVPPRPTELHLRGRPGRNPPTPPHRPVPPPPTPPKLSRSPNLERPRSSNDIIDQREQDENLGWECSQCTFGNHSAMNACEICGYSRVGSLGPHNRSPNN